MGFFSKWYFEEVLGRSFLCLGHRNSLGGSELSFVNWLKVNALIKNTTCGLTEHNAVQNILL